MKPTLMFISLLFVTLFFGFTDLTTWQGVLFMFTYASTYFFGLAVGVDSE